MAEEQQQTDIDGMSDEEAIMKIAGAMKDNIPSQEERQNVHTFLNNVIELDAISRIIKVGNLRDDKDLNELGLPRWNVRGALEMARISDMLMSNPFFTEYFERQAKETVSTSLSRNGFVIRQATTTTRQIADATKRRKINKGMFGKKNIEESGGDIIEQSGRE